MATPTGSAAEILMRQAFAMAGQRPFIEAIVRANNSILGDMIDNPRTAATVFRMRRAPQTDDMRQMLSDLGIEPARIEPSRRPADRITRVRIVTRSAML